MSESYDKLIAKAPRLVDLAEKCHASLEDAEMLGHKAKVALCIDISGTMHPLFASGRIQKFAESILLLGARFDQDLAIDIFLFGDEAYHMGEMNAENFDSFLTDAWRKYISIYGTYYGKAIKKIRQFYYPENKGDELHKVICSAEPVYVMFVTDGATADEEETVKQLVWASYEPIFWQFMAIGKSKDDFGASFWDWVNKPFAKSFNFLKKLDNMENRFIDNANFFNVPKDINVDETVLYQKMMVEYPHWVKEASKKGILTGIC